MKVIILVGGKATRLPVSASSMPKALVGVGGKPILQHQLDLFEKYGLKDIRLALGHKADQVIRYLNGKYEYVVDPKPLGTGGAIKFASNDLKDDFMAVNGDILCDIDLKKFIDKWQRVRKVNKKVKGIVATWHCPDVRDYGLMKIKNDLVKEFSEKKKRRQSGFINAGFYILSPEALKETRKKIFLIETDIFPKLSQKNQLIAFVHRGDWLDAGTEERLSLAEKAIKLK